jgi:hypothetical protein
MIADMIAMITFLVMSEKLGQKDDDICACPLGKLGPKTSIKGVRWSRQVKSVLQSYVK